MATTPGEFLWRRSSRRSNFFPMLISQRANFKTSDGCAMGGCVAQAFGGLYPARVMALGLIDTTAWYGAEAPQQWRERAAGVRKNGLAGMVDFQVSRWFGDKFRVEHPDLAQAAANVFLANDVEAYPPTCVLLGDADVRPF